MTNNYVICHAVETMMEAEIPERAEYLRVIDDGIRTSGESPSSGGGHFYST